MKTLTFVLLFVTTIGLSAEPISKNLIKSILFDSNADVTKYNVIKVKPKIKMAFSSRKENKFAKIINLIDEDENSSNIKYNNLKPNKIKRKTDK